MKATRFRAQEPRIYDIKRRRMTAVVAVADVEKSEIKRLYFLDANPCYYSKKSSSYLSV